MNITRKFLSCRNRAGGKIQRPILLERSLLTMSTEAKLPESFVKLKKLTTRDGEPIETILERGVSMLKGLKEKATLEIRVRGTKGETKAVTHTVVLTGSGASLRKGSIDGSKPTLAAILPADAFYQIADGSYSPVQAYLDGNLKLIGNVDVGRRMILHLGGPGTVAQVCPFLVRESWNFDPQQQVGTLTFTGNFFTPGGTVEILYDWGGGFFQRIAVADSRGSFTLSEGGIYCGDIPGHPGIGVFVTATDLATGKSTKDGYSTPCA
jgi:hypothetical protein